MPGSPGGLDTYGWMIANLHQMLGHDKAAAVLGVPAGSKDDCLICAYERDPSPDAKQRVINALARRADAG